MQLEQLGLQKQLGRLMLLEQLGLLRVLMLLDQLNLKKLRPLKQRPQVLLLLKQLNVFPR